MNTKTLAIFANNTDFALMEGMIMHLDHIQGRMPLALRDDRLPGVIRLSPTICGTHVCVMLHEAPDWSFQGDQWEVFEEL